MIQTESDRFHVFIWSMAVPSNDESSKVDNRANRPRSPRPATDIKRFKVNMDGFHNLLEKMDDYLRKTGHLTRHTRRAYLKCPLHSLKEPASSPQQENEGSSGEHRPDEWAWESSDQKPTGIEEPSERIEDGKFEPDFVYSSGPEKTGDNHSKSRGRPDDLLTKQKSFVKDAKALFAFFLPLETSKEMASKYWGATFRLVQVSFGFLPRLAGQLLSSCTIGWSQIRYVKGQFRGKWHLVNYLESLCQTCENDYERDVSWPRSAALEV